LGTELNDQGFDLIQQGRYEEAIPLLDRAVNEFRNSGTTGEIQYAYALFNLGHALRVAGRPQDAIPYLTERLEIPNQTGEVRKELELAQQKAGYATAQAPSGGLESESGESSGGVKPGKGPKPGEGPDEERGGDD
jgi:serine/threonine-protein kinase